MRVVLSNQNCQLSGFMFIYAGRLKDQKDFPRDPFFSLLLLYTCAVCSSEGGCRHKKGKEKEKKRETV